MVRFKQFYPKCEQVSDDYYPKCEEVSDDYYPKCEEVSDDYYPKCEEVSDDYYPKCEEVSDDYDLSEKWPTPLNEVILRNEEVERVNTAKFIGVMVDQHLN